MEINNNCNPQLSAKLTAEYLALQNDLEQARSMAEDYQRQLSDKTNAFAVLKSRLARTIIELQSLQEHIMELRKERHHLANEAMRAKALEQTVAQMAEELMRQRVGSVQFVRMDGEDCESLVLIHETVDTRPANPTPAVRDRRPSVCGVKG
jgi:chromosome segregation ATPase